MKSLSEEQKKKLPAGFEMMSMVRTNIFTNWKMNQPVALATFKFQPPADAQLVSELVPQPPHPLIGKMAPDFQLNGLDGKSVKLASLRGKIVVLDFWATWCGPCVATLPIVLEVTSSFKDRGVVFFAVNLKEKADHVRKFQTDKNLSFSVLFDANGSIADLYLAKAIPQSVVIDKDGKIQAVHVGFSSSLKTTLTQQLNDLLDGKQLAK
jgi:peroxiredoxin